MIRSIKIIYAATLIIFLIKTNVYAQAISNKGEVSVEYASGCAPFQVDIEEIFQHPDIETKQYIYIDSLIIDKSFVSKPGTYQIIELLQVLNNAFPNDRLDTLLITVLENKIPKYRLFNCNGNGVIIYNDDPEFNSLSVDFGDGNSSVFTSSISHFYAMPGTYNISIAGAGGCKKVSQIVTAVNALQPASIDLVEVLSKDSIRVRFNPQPFGRYQLEIADPNSNTGFDFLADVEDQNNELVVGGIDTENFYYCFRIKVLDLCGGNDLYSESVCSILLTTEADNNQNLISWNTNLGNDPPTIQLTKNGQIYNNGSPDIDVVCSKEYCYQLELSTVAYTSISNQSCVIAISTDIPPTITNATSSVTDNNSVEINWELPQDLNIDIQYFNVYRAIDGGSYDFVASTTVPSYQDIGLEVNQSQYCYEIDYLNACGNTSERFLTCAIHLTRESIQLTAQERQVELKWTGYIGWEEGVDTYVVHKISPDGKLLESVEVNLDLSYTDIDQDVSRQEIWYQIRAISNDGLIAYSNLIKLDFPPQLIFPALLLSDGNNLNDNFIAKGMFINEFELFVYNRWGELMFYSDNADVGWDGIYEGQQVPQGVYTFKARIKDFLGKETTKQGTITLLRGD